MVKVHLAPVGGVYSGDYDRLGRQRIRLVVEKPRTTLCDLAVTTAATKTVLSHDHPGACKTCLSKAKARTTEHLQPVILSPFKLAS